MFYRSMKKIPVKMYPIFQYLIKKTVSPLREKCFNQIQHSNKLVATPKNRSVQHTIEIEWNFKYTNVQHENNRSQHPPKKKTPKRKKMPTSYILLPQPMDLPPLLQELLIFYRGSPTAALPTPSNTVIIAYGLALSCQTFLHGGDQ